MPVPDFQSFFVPLLDAVADGGDYALVDVRDQVQAALQLSDIDVAEKLPSGTQTKFANRLAWAAVYFAKAGVLRRIRRGVFQITDRAKGCLQKSIRK